MRRRSADVAPHRRRSLQSRSWRTAEERREELKAVWQQATGCTRCPQLAAARTTVVFGSGNADADLMFVGEAPGASEDEQGVPFVGQAGRLLDTLLGEIGLTRGDVFVAQRPAVPAAAATATRCRRRSRTARSTCCRRSS